ncbi:hypothetical protein MRX96_005313 [Rhipicephalus microplus]
MPLLSPEHRCHLTAFSEGTRRSTSGAAKQSGARPCDGLGGAVKCGVGLREGRGLSGGPWRGQETRPAERAIESRSLVLDEKALEGEFQDFTLKRGEGRPPQGRIAQWVHAAECNLADIEGRVCPARAALGHRRAPLPAGGRARAAIPEAEPPGDIIAAASISVTPRRQAATLSPVR